MREIDRAREPMMTADQAREDIRSPLDFLVRHHVEAGAPRMRAYERVGAKIGRSPAWIQRVLGRRPDTTIGWHDALNISAAYERLCARIETAADASEARIKHLQEARDASGQVASAARVEPRSGSLDALAGEVEP